MVTLSKLFHLSIREKTSPISDEDEKRIREERLKKLMLAEAASRSKAAAEEDTRKLRKMAEKELQKAENRVMRKRERSAERGEKKRKKRHRRSEEMEEGEEEDEEEAEEVRTEIELLVHICLAHALSLFIMNVNHLMPAFCQNGLLSYYTSILFLSVG